MRAKYILMGICRAEVESEEALGTRDNDRKTCSQIHFPLQTEE